MPLYSIISLKESFSLAMEMVRDFAKKEGIDLESAMESEEVEAALARSEKRSDAAQAHHCSIAALDYSPTPALSFVLALMQILFFL